MCASSVIVTGKVGPPVCGPCKLTARLHSMTGVIHKVYNNGGAALFQADNGPVFTILPRDLAAKQMEHLARNHLCLEPGDLWMLADRLDTHRINYAGHVDEALHAIDNGGNDRVYAAFVQRIADRQREREQAKKAAT